MKRAISKKLISHTYAGLRSGFLNRPVRQGVRPRSSTRDASTAALTRQFFAKIDEEKRQKGGEALTPQDYSRIADALFRQICAIREENELGEAQSAPAAPRSTSTLEPKKDERFFEFLITTGIQSKVMKDLKVSLEQALLFIKIAANLEAKLTDTQPLSIPIKYSDNPAANSTATSAVAVVTAVQALKREGRVSPSELMMASRILNYLSKTASTMPPQTVDTVALLNNCCVLGRDPHLVLRNFQRITSMLFYSVIEAAITGYEKTTFSPKMGAPEFSYNLLRKSLYDTYKLTMAAHVESENLNCICFPDGRLVAKISPDMKEEEKLALEESILLEYKEALPTSAYLDLFLIDLRLNFCRLDAFHPGGLGDDPRFVRLFPLKVCYNHRLPCFEKSRFLMETKRPAPKRLGIDPAYMPFYDAVKKESLQSAFMSPNDSSTGKSLRERISSIFRELTVSYLSRGGTHVAGELMHVFFEALEAKGKRKAPILDSPNIEPVYIPIYKLFKKYRQIKLTTFRANRPVGLSLVAVTAKCLSKIYDLLHKARNVYDPDKLLSVLHQADRDVCEELNIPPRDVDPEARLISRFGKGLSFDDFEREYAWL